MPLHLDPALIKPLAERLGIEFIVLHGSAATGKMGPMSDVDVAVKTAQPLTLESIGELDLSLSPILQEHLLTVAGWQKRELDILDFDNADPVFKAELCKKGKLLYEAAPSLFHNFKVQTVLDLLDTEHFRAGQLAYLRKNYGS